MKKVLNIFRILLSVVLSFALMAMIVATSIVFFANKILAKPYILSRFNEINLYDQVLDETRGELKNYIYQSGIDEEVINNVCTKDKVQSDMIDILDSLYTGEEVKIDTKELEENLNKEVDKIVDLQNRKLSVEEEKNIKSFKKSIVDAYKDSIEFYQKENNTIQKYLPTLNSRLMLSQKMLVLGSVTIGIMILVFNCKKINKGIGYISISSLSAGVLLLLINYLITSKVEINNLLILTNALSNAITTIISDFLVSIVTVGKWAILIGVVGILLSAIAEMGKNRS